ncbi:putative uncharacterized protein [Firmicutes bacterium CAG:582]|nr:putative uncharacterized protein [Firmicutes bacterium CAG:582]
MKRIILLVLVILSMTGCTKENSKFYLNDEYYNAGKLVDIDSKELTNILKSNDSFILFTFNPYCNFKVSCENVVENFSKNNNITIFKIPFEEFKSTKLYNTIKYAPSIILINKGKIETYLDPNKDEDSIKYQEEKALKDYIEMYIDTKK